MYLLMLILLGLCVASAAGAADADASPQANPWGNAQWLRDPVFKHAPATNLYGAPGRPLPEQRGPRNVHTYLRKEFHVDAVPPAAILTFSADDYAKIYVNGVFVVQGPEPRYPWIQPYARVDVASRLRPGANVIAVHLYYQGLRNRVWDSGDNRSGFIARLDAADKQPTAAVQQKPPPLVATDDTWRCLRSTAYPSDRTTGYETQFLEDVDMRRVPRGWREAGFDDSGWRPPLVQRQDHSFAPSPAPPLEHWRAEPKTVRKTGEGSYFYDFGQELVGHTRIRISGAEGGVLDVRHGEELNGPDDVRYEMRANCTYQEFPVLSGGEDVIEFYDYKGFRYVEIRNAPEEPEVWVDVRHHPWPRQPAAFESDHDLLERIWRLCANGVRFGAQGGFLDCPTREKGQYLGDALITSRSHLVLTGDASLSRKAIEDFRESQRIRPSILAVAPGVFMQEFAEYSLQWPMLLRDFYRRAGDTGFVYRMAKEGFPPLFQYHEQFESLDGLIRGGEKPLLVDWPAAQRDDYDYDYAKTRESAALNAFYYAALEAAAEVCERVGLEADAYRERAEKVRAAYHKHLFDASRSVYVDAPGSDHASLHANALALAFAIAPSEHVPAIVDFLRDKGMACGVYMAPFLIEGLYRAGAPDLAFDLLASRGKRSWHEMLRMGATTCTESWSPDEKWNMSWCHPWSSSPVYLIAERAMGLMPAEPGWRAVRFAPNPDSRLGATSLELPIPHGRLLVEYDGNSAYTLTTPVGLPVEVDVAEGVDVEVREAVEHGPGALDAEQRRLLESKGWNERVGDDAAVWVSASDQMFRIIRDGWVLWEVPCSTAARGMGSQRGSLMTPPGWHSISGKRGAGEPWGRVFRARQAVGQIWKPGMDVSEDLVLTRILLLDGEEPGVNKGGNVDSRERFIYIHGTNGETLIGSPASHGCIRLMNDDMIDAYERLNEGVKVLITKE